MTYSTSSFNINIIRKAVTQYLAKHGAPNGDLRVVHTHISADDYTPQGHVNSELDGVVVEVSRIAQRMVVEQAERSARLNKLYDRLERGELTYEEYEREYCLSF